MKKMITILSIIRDYGLPWVVFRTLYSIKLFVLRRIPSLDFIFEHKSQIWDLDLYTFPRDEVERFLDDLPGNEKDKIVSEANNVLNGTIKAFGWLDLDYGYPINWHMNPMNNETEDRNKKWFQISDFDPVRGDIKLIWEASRFSHAYPLARAYILTKDKKYYQSFSDQISDWVKKNEYSFGANFKCGQEATLRSINILVVYSVFKSYGLTTSFDDKNVTKIVNDSYRKVLSNFFYAHRCIRNNHTLSEIAGLLIGSHLENNYPRFHRSVKLLNKEIDYQFSLDGGYIQKSFNYQRFVLDLLSFLMTIFQIENLISSKNLAKIRNSAHLLYNNSSPEGFVPNYGPNDGALLFPITSSDNRDYRSTIDTVLALIDNTTPYKYGTHSEKRIWMGKPSSIYKEINSSNNAYDEAGIFTLMNDRVRLMVINNNFKSRPSHMDQNHVDMWLGDTNLLCDLGTYSYSSDLMPILLSNLSHNTVSIHGIQQMNYLPPFMVFDWSKRKSVELNGNQYIGSYESRNGYLHERKAICGMDSVDIFDKVSTTENNAFVNFHTCCDLQIIDDAIQISFEGKILALVTSNCKWEISQCIYSGRYLDKKNCSRVSFQMLKERDNIFRSKIKINLLSR